MRIILYLEMMSINEMIIYVLAFFLVIGALFNQCGCCKSVLELENEAGNQRSMFFGSGGSAHEV